MLGWLTQRAIEATDHRSVAWTSRDVVAALAMNLKNPAISRFSPVWSTLVNRPALKHFAGPLSQLSAGRLDKARRLELVEPYWACCVCHVGNALAIPDVTATDLMKKQNYLAIWSAFAFLPIAFVGIVNYLVDPFQYFRVSNPPRFSNLMQRFQHPGVIKNYPFTSIVVGNSFVANLQNGLFDRKEFGKKPAVQNLSFWGSTFREAAFVVDLALKTKPIEIVFWGIGREWVLTDFRYGEFPTCMYGRFWSYLSYCYLLNADILAESIAIVSGWNRISKAQWVDSLNEWKAIPVGTIDVHALDCEIRHWIKDDDIDELTQLAENNLGPVQTPEIVRFREIVLPIVRGNRQVHFVFFFPPLHYWPFWLNAVKQATLHRERAMIDALIDEPNVEIHDMTGLSSVTHNSGRYSDPIHYNLEGARLVVDALASGSQKITSITQHDEMLRSQLRAGAKLVHDSFETKCPQNE
jgi:hypothetical protein